MLIEKHLRLEVGNSLVIPEGGDPETECGVTASPVGVGKPRTGHFPSVSASVISRMSPTVCKPGAVLKNWNAEWKEETSQVQERWAGVAFLPWHLSFSVSLSDCLRLDHCVVSHPCNGHQRR